MKKLRMVNGDVIDADPDDIEIINGRAYLEVDDLVPDDGQECESDDSA